MTNSSIVRKELVFFSVQKYISFYFTEKR